MAEPNTTPPPIEVVNYSQLDDLLYVQWGPLGGHMAAVPRAEALDEDPTPLCNRLRGLGLPIDPAREAEVAERVRETCSQRFPTLD